MIHKVCAVYDLKACVYLRPIFAVNTGSAMRDFGDETKNEKSILFSHPEDFHLFEIGSFDDNSGTLSPLCPVKFLVSANDFRDPKRVPVVGVSKPDLIESGNGAE